MPERSPRPRHEVAEIFRAHGQEYRQRHQLTADQLKAMRAIEICRTAELGGHVDVCLNCGYEKPAYNSCRNRHCPKCQALAQARWIESRRQRILPVPYFHVVFTLPEILRPLALWDRRHVFNLLFGSASSTLLELGRDPLRLGAQLGLTAILHTWTRDLLWHPHLHVVVTGGGLSTDRPRWVATGDDYLFPVAVLSKLFRGKFVSALSSAWQHGKLKLPPSLSGPDALGELKNSLFDQNWVVYCKRPFAGPEQVFSYLGLYTHRVGIANHRILSVTKHAVTFATRNGNTATMGPPEFIRRFLLHVLPTGFAKIRHYGLHASANVNTKLEQARRLLEPAPENNPPSPSSDVADETWDDTLKRLTGNDVRTCPACAGNNLHHRPLPKLKPPLTNPRGPP